MLAVQGVAAKIRGTGRVGRPTLVLMHFLGGSGREWDEVIALLGNDYETVTVDLPGFGDSAEMTGYTVAEMADAVEALISELRLQHYVLVGHSMSGKVAAVLARRAEDRAGNPTKNRGLEELAGLILLAPSPAGPEPMTEEKRGGMIASLGERGEREEDRTKARAYVTRNEERDMPDAVVARAADEVLRMNRTAWVAWLAYGSKEDWLERVGVLTLPVLVVAGENDASLGPETQKRVTMPHVTRGEMRVMKGCSHLIPMERPMELANMMREFVSSVSR